MITRFLYMIICYLRKILAAAAQTWGQVHEYLYLSTLKYRFESTCTLLNYFLKFPNVLVLILKYFAKYLYVFEYLKYL